MSAFKLKNTIYAQKKTLLYSSHSNEHYGRLEIFPKSNNPESQEWKTICENDFTENEIKIACKQMYGESFTGKKLDTVKTWNEGLSELLIHAESVKCDGGENSLQECDWSSSTCNADPVWLSCSPEN